MYKLMIVEDEEVIRWGLREHVPWNQYGFQVVGEACDGQSALELIPQVEPDIILTDIIMPRMNGIDLMAQVSEKYKKIKMIVLSGYNEFEYARKCIEYRTFSYLLKPTNDHEIEQVFLKAKIELDHAVGQHGSAGVQASAALDMYPQEYSPPGAAGQTETGDEESLHRESRKLMREIVQHVFQSEGDLLELSLERYFALVGGLGREEKDLYFMKIVELILFLSAKANENQIQIHYMYNPGSHLEIRKATERGDTASLKKWVMSICDDMMRSGNKMAAAELCDPVIDQAKKYVSDHFDRKITLDEVCDYVNISHSYFCSLFKQNTGETLMEYVTNIRVSKAKELLINKQLKVYEVAIMVGYDDFRHFSKTFKRVSGINPMEYREKYG